MDYQMKRTKVAERRLLEGNGVKMLISIRMQVNTLLVQSTVPCLSKGLICVPWISGDLPSDRWRQAVWRMWRGTWPIVGTNTFTSQSNKVDFPPFYLLTCQHTQLVLDIYQCVFHFLPSLLLCDIRGIHLLFHWAASPVCWLLHLPKDPFRFVLYPHTSSCPSIYGYKQDLHVYSNNRNPSRPWVSL